MSHRATGELRRLIASVGRVYYRPRRALGLHTVDEVWYLRLPCLNLLKALVLVTRDRWQVLLDLMSIVTMELVKTGLLSLGIFVSDYGVIYCADKFLFRMLKVIRPHRLYSVNNMRLIAIDVAHSGVCVSVCMLTTRMYCEYAKTAEPIEIWFGALTYVGPRNNLLDQMNPFAATQGDNLAMGPFARLLLTLAVKVHY